MVPKSCQLSCWVLLQLSPSSSRGICVLLVWDSRSQILLGGTRCFALLKVRSVQRGDPGTASREGAAPSPSPAPFPHRIPITHLPFPGPDSAGSAPGNTWEMSPPSWATKERVGGVGRLQDASFL